MIISQLIKKASLTFFIQLVGTGVAYLLVLIFTQGYGVDAFALYSLGLVIMSITSRLALLGVDTSAIKFIPSFILNKHSIVSFYIKGLVIIMLLSAVLSSIVYFGSDIIANQLFDKPQLTEYIRVFAWAVFPFALTQYNAEVLRAHNKPAWRVAFHHLIFSSFAIILIGIGWLLDQPLIEISYVYLYGISIAAFISLLVIIRTVEFTGFKTEFLWSIAPVSTDILNVSVPLMLFGAMLWISEWMNTIMLGALGGLEDVAVYRVVFRLGALMVIILNVVNTVIGPKISEMYASNDLEGMKREVLYGSKLIFWGGAAIQLVLFIGGKQILGLFGDTFANYTLALYIILIGQQVNSLCGPVALVLNVTRGQRFLSIASAIKLLLVVGINLALIPKYGVIGVAISTSVSTIVFNVMATYKVYRMLGFITIYWPIRLKKS